jgi:hypothetical protein
MRACVDTRAALRWRPVVMVSAKDFANLQDQQISLSKQRRAQCMHACHAAAEQTVSTL